ncbi:MAG: GH3 family domain-containing protein, partial [Alphaproteobacteria bacterium]
DRVRSIDDYRRALPLGRYEDFWRDYWQKAFPCLDGATWPGRMPYFAVTSGTTTGVTKYIPCSRAMVRANMRAALDVLVHHLTNRPRSRVFGGKSLLLGGSTALTPEAPGVASGDLSGIEAATTPFWARPWSYPPKAIALEPDWRRKIEALARLAPKESLRSVSGPPPWLLVLFDHIFARTPGAGTLAAIWPELELVVHGAVSFAPYRRRFAELLEGSRAETREVYAASEGFIAIADRGDGEGMRLVLDNGLFFEFIPVAELGAARPIGHWIADAQTDFDYALVVTTCAGLWRYVIGDTVRLVTREPPRVVVTGRTSYNLSAFGEHLIAEEVEESVAHAAEHAGVMVADYAVGAVVPERAGELGHHRFVVEFAPYVPARARIAAFAAALDGALAATNDDYRAHRAGGFGLGAPRVLAVAPGAFAGWLESRGQLGGQHKVPRLIADRALLDALLAFVASRDLARDDVTAG